MSKTAFVEALEDANPTIKCKRPAAEDSAGTRPYVFHGIKLHGTKPASGGSSNRGSTNHGPTLKQSTGSTIALGDGQYLYVRWTDVMPNLSFVQQTWWAIDDSGRTQFDCSTPDCMDPSCTGQDGCSGYSGPATSSGSTHPPTPLPTSPVVSARSDRFVSRRGTVATIRR